MSARNKKWNLETRAASPMPAAPSRGETEAQLERVKVQLLAPLLSSVTNDALIRELRSVANEAAALAWLTACPILVLPVLLEEKVHKALQRWERQQWLWWRHGPARSGNPAPATASILPRPVSAMMAA